MKCVHEPVRSGWDCDGCGKHLDIHGAWWWRAKPMSVFCSEACSRGKPV